MLQYYINNNIYLGPFSMKFIFTFLLLILSLKAEFCIQVYSTKSTDTNSIIRQANNPKYANFEKIRVEKRGKYFVIRIGQYRSKNEANSDLLKIKKIVPDAYSRSCTFSSQKSLFVKNNGQDIKKDFYIYPKSVNKSPFNFEVEEQHVSEVKHQTYNPIKKVKKQSNYIESQELVYPSSSTQEDESLNDDLWDQCNKCFSPIYTQEEEASYVTQKIREPQKEAVIQIKEKKIEKTEIQVRIKPKDIKKENNSFWTNENSENDEESVNFKNTHLNINEQFLP